MLAAVRIRGEVNLNPKIKHTMELLRLHSVNHLVLVDEKDKGMLAKAQSFITWGEIDAAIFGLVLEKRGRLQGDKRLGKDFLDKQKAKSFEDLAKNILEGKTNAKALGIKPVFRLHPPKGGHNRAGIKKAYKIGGALGYRAADINVLIKRMA